MHAELVSDVGYKVQAVLVEEDEEEDEDEACMAETQTQPGAPTTGTAETDVKEQEPEGEKIEEQEEEEEAKEEQSEEKEEEEAEGKKEEQLEKEKEDGKEVFKQDAEAAFAEEFQEEERMKEDKEENSQTVSQVPAEPAESAVTGGPSVVLGSYRRCLFLSPVVRLQNQPAASLLTFINMNRLQSESQPSLVGVPFRSRLTADHFFFPDVQTVCQEFQREIVVMPTNGMTNGEEHNGIGLAANHSEHHFVPSGLSLMGRSLFLRAISQSL